MVRVVPFLVAILAAGVCTFAGAADPLLHRSGFLAASNSGRNRRRWWCPAPSRSQKDDGGDEELQVVGQGRAHQRDERERNERERQDSSN